MPHQHAFHPEQAEGEALRHWQREQQEAHERAEAEDRERRAKNPPISQPDALSEAFVNLQDKPKGGDQS